MGIKVPEKPARITTKEFMKVAAPEEAGALARFRSDMIWLKKCFRDHSRSPK